MATRSSLWQLSQRTNLGSAFYHDRFSFYEHDVTEFIHLSVDLDWLIHLASLTSPIFYLDQPIEMLKLSALGSRRSF